EFAMYGFRINETKIDEHGTHFVARYKKGALIEVFVRSLRQENSYTFLEKAKFTLGERRYVAFGLLLEGKPPSLYLIPSTRWKTPDKVVFLDKNYEGYKSAPEWGLVVSPKNMELLAPYHFELTIAQLIEEAIRKIS